MSDNPGSLLINSSPKLEPFSKYLLCLPKLPLVIIIDCNSFLSFSCLYNVLTS